MVKSKNIMEEPVNIETEVELGVNYDKAKVAANIGGAEVDVRQMSRMYFALGINPWSFMAYNAHDLKDQMERAEKMGRGW